MNRDRQLTTHMPRKVMAAILAHPEVGPRLSDEYFSAGGTLVKAWASMKSFQPKDSAPPHDDDYGGPPPADDTFADTSQSQQSEAQPMPDTPCHTRNADMNFRGEKRSNATHASVTDPDAHLYKKAPGAAAILWFVGHTAMENRKGLVVQAELTHADGHGERKAALEMINHHSLGSTLRQTLGADKGYHSAGFVTELRHMVVTPHVAQKARHSAIYSRTTRQPGYAMSRQRRRKIEEPFGWAKTVGRKAQTVHRGIDRVRAQFTMTMAACNLGRLPKLLAV